MKRYGTINLITETKAKHGVHEAVTETARTVMCEVGSVSRSEFYTALNAGVQPEYVFRLALAEEYQGERVVRYGGQKLRVIRSYMTSDDGIELTCERWDVNGTE